MQSRCEVCDDTNATIHCQECRRKTCEECDEILHLVDANKSHNRISLFPSRGASAVNSRSGSQVPTRNVSPRGPRRPFQEQENAIAEYTANKPDYSDSSPAPDRQLFGADSGADTFAPKRHAPPQQEVPVSQAPPAPNVPLQTANHYSNPPPPSQQMQRAAPPPPQHQAPPPQQQQQQQQLQQPPHPPHPPQQQAPPPPHHQRQQHPGRAQEPRPVQPLQPFARADPPRQPMHHQPGQSRSGYATPSYGQYNPGSRTGPHSVSHSGAATPTYGARPVVFNQYRQQQNPEHGQHPVYQNQPMSQPYNGDAGRRFPADARPVSTNEDQMRKAYLQHMAVIEQHKAVEAHQRLMAQRSDMMARQPPPHHPFHRHPQMPGPQRYVVNMPPSSFSSAAPSARNSPPLQPIRPASGMVSGHVSGFVTPGGDPSRAMMPMDPGRPFYPPPPLPQPGPQMMSFVPAPPGPPIFDPVRGTFAAPPHAVYSMPASAARTPLHLEPPSPPSFMPPRAPMMPYGVSARPNDMPATHVTSSDAAPSHPSAASVPRTPYNEPRTPYNEPRTPFEPRSPAAEPVAYGERMPARPVSFPLPPSSMAAPPPPRPAVYAPRDYAPPPPPSNPQAAPHHHHAPPPPPQATRALPPPNQAPTSAAPPPPQYHDHLAQYRTLDISQKPPTISTNHIPPPKEDVVMTPNGSLNRVMADAERALPPAHAAPRYDPDEAETRVRNLIADTERMLAGLSGFSAGKGQTNGVSV